MKNNSIAHSIDTLIEKALPTRIAELKEWLRIPSISTLPEHAPDVQKAAEWAVAFLKTHRFPTAKIIKTQGHPLVYGEWIVDKHQPTVLIYGHYDVQPADPLELWQTPPFEPTERNGNLYARGANDDKGQCMVWLGALAALIARDGKPPINIKVIVEGEEEGGGSRHLAAYLQTHAQQFACDCVYVCDTSMPSEKSPAITSGLRGITYTEVTITGAKGDLHSGEYGGIAPNPFHAFCLLMSRLKGEDGKINIPELMKAVPKPPKVEKEFWVKDPLKRAKELLSAMGIKAFVGNNKLPPLERLGAQPTLEIHGIKGGFVGEGAKTVIPCTLTAKVSLRLPAGISSNQAFKWFRTAVSKHLPQGYKATVTNLHGGEGVAISPNNPYMQLAASSMKEVYGKAPVFMREGGSIPIAALFDSILKVPVVLMGFGLPDDGLHAPNEKYSLAQLHKGMRTVARFLEGLKK
ncbi:MAG: dipeptidase [Alphaproteobacteria bacterium]